MRATADPVHDSTSDDVVIVKIKRATLAHWAEVVAYAIDNPDTYMDALLELAEQIEEVAGCAR